MLEASDDCVVDEEKNNVCVLGNIKPEWTLESMGARYFGHVVREERGMENDVMRGDMSGKSRRGRPITRWLDDINTIKGPSITSMRWDARDRDRWRSATAVVAMCRTRLDGTSYNLIMHFSLFSFFLSHKCVIT